MITYTEVPSTIVKTLLVAKQSQALAINCIPNIPISTGQSYILANTADRINMTNYIPYVTTLGGFDTATGIWTCPKDGYYNLYLRVVIAANNVVNSVAGYEIGDFGQGSFIWALRNNLNAIIYLYNDITCYGTGGSYVSNVGIRCSVINFSNQVERFYLTSGTQMIVSALNKTQLAYLATNPANSVYQSLTLKIDEVA